jgi:DNA-binding XRE family transcriptional regulator
MKKTVVLDEEALRLMKKIAKNIKSMRTRQGLLQQDMSTHGFNYRWFQRLESGHHVPTLPTLIKLSRVFQCDIVDFFK